jgi:ubiquitin carboxyl-terminal hydrolase 25/28
MAIPGKTAPRLIQDLLDHDPRFPTAWNVLSEVSPIFREGQTLFIKNENTCRHALCAKDNQSRVPVSNDERPDENSVYVIAAYCSRCRYHFKVSVDYRPQRSGQVPCHLSDSDNPLHHFRLVGTTDGKQYKEKHGPNKYDVLTEAHVFRCTSPTCPAMLEIRVSPPKLTKNIMISILSPEIVTNRGKREMEKEPERYVGQTPVTPSMAIVYLRHYLSDAKTTTATGEIKKIARRNKKFMLAFADDCDTLYEYLDFKLVEVPGDEGVSHICSLS